MSEIYLVRHGETNFNQAGKLQGHTESRLTERGQQQARDVAAYFDGISCARLITSDLIRCRETAELIGDKINLNTEAEPRLRELGLGEAEGLHRSEALAQYPGLANLWDHPGKPPAPNGETPQQLQHRIRSFLDEFISELCEETAPTIVVTHAGPILTMVSLASQYTLKEAQNLSLANGGICKLMITHRKLSIATFNMTAHLHDMHLKDDACAYER